MYVKQLLRNLWQQWMLDASQGSRYIEGIEGSMDVEGIEGSISGSRSIEGIESCMGSKGSSSIKGSMALRAQWARGVQRALKALWTQEIQGALSCTIYIGNYAWYIICNVYSLCVLYTSVWHAWIKNTRCMVALRLNRQDCITSDWNGSTGSDLSRSEKVGEFGKSDAVQSFQSDVIQSRQLFDSISARPFI